MLRSKTIDKHLDRLGNEPALSSSRANGNIYLQSTSPEDLEKLSCLFFKDNKNSNNTESSQSNILKPLTLKSMPDEPTPRINLSSDLSDNAAYKGKFTTVTQTKFGRTIIELHNCSQSDMTKLIDRLDNQEKNGRDAYHIFERLAPGILLAMPTNHMGEARGNLLRAFQENKMKIANDVSQEVNKLIKTHQVYRMSQNDLTLFVMNVIAKNILLVDQLPPNTLSLLLNINRMMDIDNLLIYLLFPMTGYLNPLIYYERYQAKKWLKQMKYLSKAHNQDPWILLASESLAKALHTLIRIIHDRSKEKSVIDARNEIIRLKQSGNFSLEAILNLPNLYALCVDSIRRDLPQRGILRYAHEAIPEYNITANSIVNINLNINNASSFPFSAGRRRCPASFGFALSFMMTFAATLLENTRVDITPTTAMYYFFDELEKIDINECYIKAINEWKLPSHSTRSPREICFINALELCQKLIRNIPISPNDLLSIFNSENRHLAALFQNEFDEKKTLAGKIKIILFQTRLLPSYSDLSTTYSMICGYNDYNTFSRSDLQNLDKFNKENSVNRYGFLSWMRNIFNNEQQHDARNTIRRKFI